MELPSQEEQMIAEQYVLEREIIRPDTDVKKALKYVCLYIALSTVLSLVSFHLLNRLGIFHMLPAPVIHFYQKYPGAFKVIFSLFILIIVGLICLKKALIGVIRLYQHYASEEVRRRCLFKPTCSEYAILALQKYGVVIGLYKTYIRLFKKCRGNIYRIDFP